MSSALGCGGPAQAVPSLPDPATQGYGARARPLNALNGETFSGPAPEDFTFLPQEVATGCRHRS